MRNLPWPEMKSSEAPERTIRDLLDYICWITTEMRQLGFHSGSDRDHWCQRVHSAYAALFIPVIAGYGDAYPPDVPPARNPGIWPDIPSARVPGMTLRHQLKVMEEVALRLRKRVWIHPRPEDVAAWDRRLLAACEALDHGDRAPMPEEARTTISQEAMEQAAVAAKALKDRARRRGLQLRQQFAAARKAKAAKKKAAPKKKAASKKKVAPKKKAASKKKVAPKKKAASKKKAAPKKRAAQKKKAAPKKKAASKRKTARKKKATPKKK